MNVWVRKELKQIISCVFIKYNFCPHLEGPVQCSAALIIEVFKLVNSFWSIATGDSSVWLRSSGFLAAL